MRHATWGWVSLTALAVACGGTREAKIPPMPEPIETPASAEDELEAMAGEEIPDAPAPSDEPAAQSIDYGAIVAAADRSEDDKKLDAGRKPAKLLEFIGVSPGMRVAELGAGGGYTSELLARAVGPKGKVYGQNSKAILAHFAEKPWAARLAKPVMSNVIRVDREFDDPFPPKATNLDAVVVVLFYHDTVWMKTDRAKMHKAVFAALKAGGTYVIVDHSAKKGDGVKVAEKLHRIEESIVRDEVEKAGFSFDSAGEFLRNGDDKRDWNASPKAAGARRGQSDRFALKFKKPAG